MPGWPSAPESCTKVTGSSMRSLRGGGGGGGGGALLVTALEELPIYGNWNLGAAK